MYPIVLIQTIKTSSPPIVNTTLYKHKIQVKYTPQVDPWMTNQRERLELHPTQRSAIVTCAGVIVTNAGAIVTSAGAIVTSAGAIVTSAVAIVTSAGASTHSTLGVPDEC